MARDPKRFMQWKAFDQRRWAYESYAIRRVRKALAEMIRPVTRSASLREAQGAVDAMSSVPMLRAFQDIYGRVGSDFAFQSFRELKGESNNIETKLDSQNEWLRFMAEWIALNGVDRIDGITLTTQRRLQVAIQDAIQSGEGIQQVARRIVTTGSGIADLNRARVIARTEIISASNAGSLEGAYATGVEFQKEWLATQDDRTRDAHLVADGQRTNKDGDFLVDGEPLEYPGALNGSPANVINCRCTLLYITRDFSDLSEVSDTLDVPDAIVEQFNINVDGFKNSDEIKRNTASIVNELKIKGDINIINQSLGGNLGGGVSFIKQSDGNYILSNNVVIDGSMSILRQKEILAHELRHLYQRDYKEFKIIATGSNSSQGMYYEGKRIISINAYNKILRGMKNKTNVALQNQSYNRYIKLPWEADAMIYESVVNRLKNVGELDFLYPIDMIELPSGLDTTIEP